jgi:hypothetical protein
MLKEIQVKCTGSMTLDIDQLVPFQGELKSLSKSNHDKLRKQIIELGFSEPFCVWKNEGKYFLINGHQRLKVLTDMKLAEGFKIPRLPWVEVEADSEYQAKKKVLALTSQFGEITSASLFDFAALANIDLPTLEDFRFPEIDFSIPDGFQEPPEKKAPELKEPELKTCPSCGVIIE